MFAKNVVAASALLSLAAAVPMQGAHRHQHPHGKRDLVWVTETDVDIVTVPVTYTVWVNPEEATAAPTQYTHHFTRTETVASPSSTSEAASSSNTSSASEYSAPSSSTSEYVAPTSTDVAPTTSSTSTYVAPTTSTYVAPTTSTYVAPTTSTYVAPTTSTYVAPTTTSAAAAATSSSSSSSSSSGSGLTYGLAKSGTSYTGDITYYTPGLGSCGITSTDSEAIVAISESMFDSYSAEAGGNPNNNPVCGKKISITGTDGSQYSATVVDRCTGCDQSSIDLSPSLFTTVAPSGDGRVHNIKWVWS